MKKRIIAALIMIPLTVAVLLAGNKIVSAAVALLAIAATYEICVSYGFNKRGNRAALLYVMLSTLFVGLLTASSSRLFVSSDIVHMGFFVYLFAGFIIILLNHGKIKVRDLMSAVALCSAVTFFFMYAVNIRTDFAQGRLLLWIVPIGACMTDTFALFIGKYFGKRKLAPSISPKKTVAGSVGGIVGAVASLLVYGAALTLMKPEIRVNFPALGILGLLSSIAAQVGDLSMSAVKREAGIKDYGNIIPGHGGILDRIDSIVFTAPLVYWFLKYITVIC